MGANGQGWDGGERAEKKSKILETGRNEAKNEKERKEKGG